MNVATITLLGFGTDESGERFARLEFQPLVGDSKEPRIVLLKKGDSLTTDVPIAENENLPLPASQV